MPKKIYKIRFGHLHENSKKRGTKKYFRHTEIIGLKWVFDTCVNNKSKSSFTIASFHPAFTLLKKVSKAWVTIYYLAKYQNRYKLQGPRQRFNNLATHFTISRLDIKERLWTKTFFCATRYAQKEGAMIGSQTKLFFFTPIQTSFQYLTICQQYSWEKNLENG